MGMGRGGPQATVVRVAKVAAGSIDARSTYVAETRPGADVRLSAEVSGILEAVYVDLGDEVERGQILARVRSGTFSQAVGEARASVGQAEAAVLRAGVDLDLAEKELHRAGKLHERGAITGSEMETIEGRHRSARAALELARADERARRARLERARIDMANTKIAAPFSGAIAERSVDPGALVSPGTQLFRIIDTGQIVARFAAPSADVARMAVGKDVEVSFDALGGPPIRGMIDRVSPLVDQQTRTTAVEVILDGGDGVRPGMFARVTAVLESREDVPLAPVPALVSRQVSDVDQARDGVFVVRGETAHFTVIEQGVRGRDYVEVLGGLEVGDSIVVAGHSQLRDGGAVRLFEEREDRAAASGNEREGS